MDDETKAKIDAAVKEALAVADKQREEKGKWIRAWIVAKPLPAARVIGTVCLIVGVGLGYLACTFIK